MASWWNASIAALALGLAVPAPARASASEASAPRATWVWDTAALRAPERVEHLVAHCQRFSVGHVFLQVPGTGAAHRRAEHLMPMRTVVERLHRAGIRVDALDGAPELARRSQHARVLATLAAVADYNRSVPAAARFDGFRLDVEAYLLPEYGDRRRDALLGDYLRLLAAVQRNKAAGLQFGVDIPFWFDTLPSQGARKSYLEDVLAHVDNASIMAYRTELEGANGVLALIENELTLARKHDRRIFIALDTAPGAATESFHNQSRAALERAVAALEQRLDRHPAAAAVALHSYESLQAL